MPYTNETIKAIKEAGALCSETAPSEQDVILLYSMLTDAHDQLVRIKRRVGIGLILIALAIVFS